MFKYFRKTSNEICKEFEFIDNQYEEYNEQGRFLYNEPVYARYIEQDLPEYKGNMLIEALPPIYSTIQVIEKLRKDPIYNVQEREKSIEYRVQAISRLENYLYPIPKHLLIERQLSVVIRRGYALKHVLTPQFIKKLNFNSRVINNKWVEDKISKMQCISSNSDAPTPGFSVIGISGGGKSTALNNILSLYPQCIIHTEYDNLKFLFKQLVYIKIDCTHNGNIKGICRKFFSEVDKVLGTDYLKKYGDRSRHSIDDMIARMAHIAQIHALGTLVIDEIQHLADARNGAEEVLNFLVTLENELKIPIIYVGTYKAIKKVLSKDFRQGRRASGMGEIEWNRMANDKYFERFMKNLWKYQWLKYETPIDEGFINLFYEKTMGITDRVIKLFMAVQYEAIISRVEKITKA